MTHDDTNDNDAVGETSADRPDGPGSPLRPMVSAFSRRLLLTRGSLAVAAAGVASAMPSLSGLTSEAETAAPAIDTAAPATEAALSDGETLDGPFVAQIHDLASGEMSLYSGEREILFRDPALAARLFRAAQ